MSEPAPYWTIEGLPEPTTVDGNRICITLTGGTPICRHVWRYAKTVKDWRHPYAVDVFYCEHCLAREERPA